MAREDMIMPQLGESVAEGTILKWLKQVGDPVEADEMILEISTDKIDTEIPAPFKGTLVEICCQEGETVEVRSVIAIIETDVSQVSELPTPTSTPIATETVANTTVLPSADIPSRQGNRFYSPLVRRIAKENNISLDELETIPGSGVGGRVNRHDIENFIKGAQTTSSVVVEKAMVAPAPAVSTIEPLPEVVPTQSAGAYSGDINVVPMDNMRRAIAKHMVESKQTSAHVLSVYETDLTHIVAWREKWKDHFFKKYGFKLTYTPIISQCVVQALREFPWLNASVDGNNVIEHKKINLGIAVALDDGGLIVPVIKNAEDYNLLGLCRSVKELSEKARSKKLVVSDLEGGTFTITNPGIYGSIMGFPIINQPQVAILGMNAIVKRPMVVEGDAIAIRSMMYLNMAYDHRIVDGMLACKFLQRLCQLIADFDVTSEP